MMICSFIYLYSTITIFIVSHLIFHSSGEKQPAGVTSGRAHSEEVSESVQSLRKKFEENRISAPDPGQKPSVTGKVSMHYQVCALFLFSSST